MNYTRFSKYIRCAISFTVVFHPMLFSMYSDGLANLSKNYCIDVKSPKALVRLQSIPLKDIEKKLQPTVISEDLRSLVPKMEEEARKVREMLR